MRYFQELPYRQLAIVTAGLILMTQVAQAHFIWLAPESDGETSTIQVYFGEDASPDDPAMLKYVDGMQAWSLQSGKEPVSLELKKTENALSVELSGQQSQGLVIAAHDLGVMDRGDKKFRLKYFAKTGPVASSTAWKNIDASKQLKLDVTPQPTAEGVLLHVAYEGKSLEASEVKANGPGLEDFEARTGESGTVLIPATQEGLYSIRAKHVDTIPGSLEGKDYPETRYYTTLTLRVQSDSSQVLGQNLQPLQQPVTSFGGAMLNGKLYIYGGHTGGAHAYSNDAQAHTLEQLDLATGEWSSLVEGPRLQGLALVSDGKRLYRIGGFTAKNAEGEDHDLWSQSSVAAIAPGEKEWTELPALPEPRSSFDAAILDGKIYVIGGWSMAGEADSVWHETAWVLDTNHESLAWEALPNPPFQRRALAVAAHEGKIYAIGGMESDGSPTRAVSIYHPAEKQWTTGPEVVGEDGMTGFGSSAFATGGHLYVSTIKGDLQRLAEDGKSWEVIAKTPTPRFFHRMLPVDEQRLVVVGGASMEIGKFEDVEILAVE